MAEDKDTRTDEGESTQDESGAKSDELGEAGKRAIQAERKRAAAAEKELKEIRAKLKEAEDAEKSEIERLNDQVDEWKSRAEKAEADSVRNAIAAAKGLSMAQARRLVGSTKEELEADADEMVVELGLKKDEGKEEEGKNEETPQDERDLGRPREDLKGGASNEGDQEPDASKVAEQILKSPF